MGIDQTIGTVTSQAVYPVVVSVLKGKGPFGELRFSESFIIGRSRECGLRIKEPSVSRRHLEVFFDCNCREWWL